MLRSRRTCPNQRLPSTNSDTLPNSMCVSEEVNGSSNRLYSRCACWTAKSDTSQDGGSRWCAQSDTAQDRSGGWNRSREGGSRSMATSDRVARLHRAGDNVCP